MQKEMMLGRAAGVPASTRNAKSRDHAKHSELAAGI